MDLPSGGPPVAYVVSCHDCKQPFDACQAHLCGCLVRRRSFTCPHCRTCFCRAPQSYKQRFWEGAPRSVWDLVAPAKGTAEELPENPDAAAARHPLVLVVDDENEILRLAFAAITGLGYQVILASDGEEGLRLAASHKPELVLTDAFMPKLDGREMCRRIKTNPATSAAKVVVMTSLYTASRYKYEAFKDFQADDYLPKPLEFGALEGLLRRHLEPKA